MPRSNWNQWLCKALGDKQGALSSRWKWRIFIKNWSSSPSTPPYKTSLLLILFGNWALPYTACQWLNEREKGWGCWRGVDHTHSSTQTSFGVRSSRIHFSTPKDVCGEASPTLPSLGEEWGKELAWVNSVFISFAIIMKIYVKKIKRN